MFYTSNPKKLCEEESAERQGRGRGLIRRFMDFSLAKKMLFLYLLIVLFPVVTFTTFYLGSMVEELNAQYQESRESLLHQAAQSIRNNLSQIEFCSSSFRQQRRAGNMWRTRTSPTATASTCTSPACSPPSSSSAAATRFSSIRVPRPPAGDERPLQRPQPGGFALSLPLERPLATGLTLMLDLAGAESRCVVLKHLYSDKYTARSGTTEIVCDADYLLSPLHFVEDGEYLLLARGSAYRVAHAADGGRLSITAFSGEPQGCPNTAEAALRRSAPDRLLVPGHSRVLPPVLLDDTGHRGAILAFSALSTLRLSLIQSASPA